MIFFLKFLAFCVVDRFHICQAAFPCRSTERSDSGSTDVEMDPVSQVMTIEAIANHGLVVCGWYHSHPTFKPDPSVTDIDNQASYQQLMMRDMKCCRAKRFGIIESQGCCSTPFVGLIVGTYSGKYILFHKHFFSFTFENHNKSNSQTLFFSIGRNLTPLSVWNWFHVTPKASVVAVDFPPDDGPSANPSLSKNAIKEQISVVSFPRSLDVTHRVFRRFVDVSRCAVSSSS